MPRTLIEAHLFPPIGPYSHAVKAGGQIFISGTPGVDPATGQLAGPDAYTQTLQTLKNVEAMLAAAKAGLDDVVHIQVNMVEVAEFAEMNRAYAELFSEPYPARTVIGVAALPKPGARLTMNVIAVAKD